MKVVSLLLVAAALLVVSATAWPPFFPPYMPLWPPQYPFFPPQPNPYFPPEPYPYFPFPPQQGGSVPPPTSLGGGPSFSPVGDKNQCTLAFSDLRSTACNPNSYEPYLCCMYLTRLGKACSDVTSYYSSPNYQAFYKFVCIGPFEPEPSSRPLS